MKAKPSLIGKGGSACSELAQNILCALHHLILLGEKKKLRRHHLLPLNGQRYSRSNHSSCSTLFGDARNPTRD